MFGKGVDFIDITSISREAKFNPSLVGTDSLHPSYKMYSIWVKKMIPYFALKSVSYTHLTLPTKVRV